MYKYCDFEKNMNSIIYMFILKFIFCAGPEKKYNSLQVVEKLNDNNTSEKNICPMYETNESYIAYLLVHYTRHQLYKDIVEMLGFNHIMPTEFDTYRKIFSEDLESKKDEYLRPLNEDEKKREDFEIQTKVNQEDIKKRKENEKETQAIENDLHWEIVNNLLQQEKNETEAEKKERIKIGIEKFGQKYNDFRNKYELAKIIEFIDRWDKRHDVLWNN